jgi:hypothetical protein
MPERHSDEAAPLLDDQHELALNCRLVTADECRANALADGPLGRHVLWVGMP